MKDPLGVSPSKGNQGTTRDKEKIILTSVGIEPTTSGIDLPLLCRLSYEVGQRKSGTIVCLSANFEWNLLLGFLRLGLITVIIARLNFLHKESIALAEVLAFTLVSILKITKNVLILRSLLTGVLIFCLLKLIGQKKSEFFSYYRILISRMRCNFWQSLNKFCTWGSEPP